MEDATELGNHLPLFFKTRSEQDNITFLWEAFETNYTHDKYQFAFLAYNMLTTAEKTRGGNPWLTCLLFRDTISPGKEETIRHKELTVL